MRGLAEFIMRGRWQALGVAVLGSGSLLFGWISAAAIALVTLRRGTAAGGWLVLWALLPAVIITAMTGDTGSVMLLAGAFGLAVILRGDGQSLTCRDGECATGSVEWLGIDRFERPFLGGADHNV